MCPKIVTGRKLIPSGCSDHPILQLAVNVGFRTCHWEGLHCGGNRTE